MVQRIGEYGFGRQLDDEGGIVFRHPEERGGEGVGAFGFAGGLELGGEEHEAAVEVGTTIFHAVVHVLRDRGLTQGFHDLLGILRSLGNDGFGGFRLFSGAGFFY